MLSFAVYDNGQLARDVDLNGAYVIGTDDVPLRAEISFAGGVIECSKRAAGPAGLALLWDIDGVGRVLVGTIRVQEREEPYILQVELARGRLLRLIHKLEDWGLVYLEEYASLRERIESARDLLIQSLQAEAPEEAARIADRSLSLSMSAGEELARLHARQQLAQQGKPPVPRRFFGCTVSLSPPSELLHKRLSDAVDFVTLPLVWRDLEPTEQSFNWRPLDAWVEALAKSRTPIHASPLLSFTERNVPPWLYLWEHDFDTMRDLSFEHVRRVMNRYGQYINAWTAISGIHATTCFSFNFEQLMELTRMSASLAKQTSPRGTILVEIVTPWGEYYADNQRTIPPLLYADMVIQSGVAFDAFAVRIQFGPGSPGTGLRDLFEISAMLDQFSKFGKPLHLTAIEVPSEPIPRTDPQQGPSYAGGHPAEPWSEPVQAGWLDNVVHIALSKSFVESVSWHLLADHGGMVVPCGGLLRSDLAPKAAYNKLIELRPLLAASTPATAPSEQ